MGRSAVNAWGELPVTVLNHSIDSLRWELIRLRAGDVVVTSWAKAGTTWLQHVVTQMLYGIGGRYMLPRVAPWVESPYVPAQRLEQLESGRSPACRVFKSHLDAKAMPYLESSRYIYVARDGRDAVWSWYQHHRRLRPAVYDAMGKLSGGRFTPLMPPNEDFAVYFKEWLDGDGYPLWSFWSHIRSWWELRERSNVLVLHYEDILAEPRKRIVEIAGFLGLTFGAEDVDKLVAMSSKDYMARNINWISPDISLALNGGGGVFFSGKRRGWREMLSDSEMERYQRTAVRELDTELAEWLAHHANQSS